MKYNTEIFQHYFNKESDQDYLKVHGANQESYLDNLAGLLPADKNSRILEIGSGAGQFLYYLKNAGYKNIEGVDIGAEQIALLEEMGIKGEVIGSIPAYLEDKADHYEFIIANQVVEHFTKEELWLNLKAVHAALRKGGIFLFTTPNMACISGLFQRYNDFTHELGFSERSAHQVMRTAGFRDISVRPDAVRLKMRPRRIGWWLCNKLWRALLGFIYYVEKGMDRPKILSRDLIVIGRK